MCKKGADAGCALRPRKAPLNQFFFDGTGNAVQTTISNENKEFKQFQEKG